MAYLISAFWFWLVLVLVLGLVIGWWTWARDGQGWRGLWPWLVALGVGAVIAYWQFVPQRFGYLVDLGVIMFGTYVVACLFGGLLRGWTSASVADAQMSIVPRADPPVLTERAVEPAIAARPTEGGPEPIEEAITGLSRARGGKADDLKKIYGIDAEVEARLNHLGLYHYDQLASLTPGQRRWMFRQLGHEGRFPSWWWRWRYDAEQLIALKGKSSAKAESVAKSPAARSAPNPPVVPVAGDGLEGSKPAGLDAPRDGKADDLKRIRGIGKQNEGRLHGLGIWHFDQIANWSAPEATWVGGFLAFPGRIEREDWVAQAKILAAGGITDFAKRADAGLVATSRDETGDDGQGNIVVPEPLTKSRSRGKPS
jgi:predicted flap endonuclease-1-like 5' DNA nuclease